MKRTLRLFACLLALLLTLGSLPALWSCQSHTAQKPSWGNYPSDESSAPGSDLSSETDESGTPVDPECTFRQDGYEYHLRQKDVDAVDARLQSLQEIFLSEEVLSEEVLLANLEETERMFYEVSEQSQLAYIFYCLDQTDSKRSAAYLYASAVTADLYDHYMEVCRTIDQSAPQDKKQFFFSDWTDAELQQMRNFSAELTELSKQNQNLLVQSRELGDSSKDRATFEQYYAQMVKNNTRIAQLSGYKNYRSYAYEVIYERTYGDAEIDSLRRFIEELIPHYMKMVEDLSIQCQSLSPEQIQILLQLLTSDYDEQADDFLNGYLDSYGADISARMRGMLQNAFFTDSENAYPAAFTGFLQSREKPVCYFGPGYQGLYTVIHEMGHYQAEISAGSDDIPLDLAETQSQGNEWMLTAYLSDILDPDLAQTFVLAQTIDAFSSIILGAAVDYFEELYYTAYENGWSISYSDAVEQTYRMFGGKSYFTTYLADLDAYTRLVVMESPVYYISYSVSMMYAVQLFCVAQEVSYATAQDAYRILSERDAELGLPALAESAGLLHFVSPELHRQLIQMCELLVN